MSDPPTAWWWLSRFVIWTVVMGGLAGLTWIACLFWQRDDHEAVVGLMVLSLIGWSVIMSLAAKSMYAKRYGGLSQASGDWFELVLVILYVWIYPLVVMCTPFFGGVEAVLVKRNPGVAAVGMTSWLGAAVVGLVASLWLG